MEEFEFIEFLTRKIFENSGNVAKYSVNRIGRKYIIKIYNSKRKVVFGMEGDCNNILFICKLILKEQETNGGKLYEQQQ